MELFNKIDRILGVIGFTVTSTMAAACIYYTYINPEANVTHSSHTGYDYVGKY